MIRPSSPMLSSRSHSSRQPLLARSVRLSCLLSGEVVNPSSIGLHFLPFAHRRGQVQPAHGIAYRADLIADRHGRVTAHAVVKVLIGQKLVQVIGYGLMVARLDKKTVLFMLHLKWDAASSRSDYGNTFVQTTGISPD